METVFFKDVICRKFAIEGYFGKTCALIPSSKDKKQKTADEFKALVNNYLWYERMHSMRNAVEGLRELVPIIVANRTNYILKENSIQNEFLMNLIRAYKYKFGEIKEDKILTGECDVSAELLNFTIEDKTEYRIMERIFSETACNIKLHLESFEKCYN